MAAVNEESSTEQILVDLVPLKAGKHKFGQGYCFYHPSESCPNTTRSGEDVQVFERFGLKLCIP
jgi:hypothetical protein